MNDLSNCCPICQRLLTLATEHSGNRCINPSHWQAAGKLSSTDYYAMARMIAETKTELDSRASSSNKTFPS